jgi:hypothetical protein
MPPTRVNDYRRAIFQLRRGLEYRDTRPRNIRYDVFFPDFGEELLLRIVRLCRARRGARIEGNDILRSCEGNHRQRRK